MRPEPQAKWAAALPTGRWQAADGEYVKAGNGRRGEWKFRKPIPARWAMQRGDLKFWVQPAPSGHVGVFPDQACHWDWIAEVTRRAARPVKVLCLFGHTGLATLAAAAAGAEVTHVDASRKAVAWARENQSLSGLSERPIRWIVEDALTFVRREARRGNRYDAMMIDPPKFGRGPGGRDVEVGRVASGVAESVQESAERFAGFHVAECVCDGADARASRKRSGGSCRGRLKEMLGEFRPTITAGELALEDGARRRISASVFARAQF